MSKTGKYEAMTEILRKSKPLLPHPEIFEEKVMDKIREQKRRSVADGFIDHLFGWVFIGWVRNSLISLSVMIIAFFAIQQTLILKRINNLERQALYTGSPSGRSSVANQDASYMKYINSPGKLQLRNDKISEREMKRIYESLNDLQTRYRELIKIIDENPELRQYIEEKLTESDKKKFKL
jgi:hypothetical protein